MRNLVYGRFAPGAVVRDNRFRSRHVIPPLLSSLKSARLPRQLCAKASYESRGAKNVNTFKLVGLISRFGVWSKSIASPVA